jgi:hypothetical protein
MPIYVYHCPVGHRTEFLKLKKDEEEPKVCRHLTTEVQKRTGQPETFECGLPLEKVVAPTNWKYTRGKNVNWPLADPVDPTPQGPDEVY